MKNFFMKNGLFVGFFILFVGAVFSWLGYAAFQKPSHLMKCNPVRNEVTDPSSCGKPMYITYYSNVNSTLNEEWVYRNGSLFVSEGKIVSFKYTPWN